MEKGTWVAVKVKGITYGMCGVLTGEKTPEGKLEVQFQGPWVGYYFPNEITP